MHDDLNEQANPVSKTAVATLFQLAGAGYEKSEEILKRLGFQKADYAWSLGDRDELEKTCMVANRESRYVALDNAAARSGCAIIYDLPCGFVHRAFDMAERGLTYVGGDLPEVVDAMEPVVRGMLTPADRARVRFAEVDITNYPSVARALEGLEGSVCVCTEGLFVYLNPSDKETVLRNMRQLLGEKGGCWLTVDPETLARHMAVYAAIAGDRAPEFLREEMRGFSGESEIDIADKNAPFLGKDGDTAGCSESEEEFRRNGFLLEKIPFTQGDYTLRSYAFLPPEAVARLQKALARIHVWKLTPDPAFVLQEDDTPGGRFRLRSEAADGTLHLRLGGRLDSLSAPRLLQAWEEEQTSGAIRRAEIDCRNLTYISSAGLRVLMIMKKALPEPPVLLHVSPEVREILTVTGFDEIFAIREGGEAPIPSFAGEPSGKEETAAGHNQNGR